MEDAVRRAKPELTVRTELPLNLETHVERLVDDVTPVERFFVRSHGAVPAVDLASWRLDVRGLVHAPLSIDHAALRALPSVTRTLMLECAGNGRAAYEPPARGLAWGRGAVSQASWTGVLLADLLGQVGISPGGRHVRLEGADPPVKDNPQYLRSIPLEDVAARGVLLAWAMNGEPLTPAHGFPLRVVVPGWTGQHWMKWLTSIEVAATPSPGKFMADEYTLPGPGGGMAPIRGSRVKSLIATPLEGETRSGDSVHVTGLAWAGEADIARVEISIDDGTTWLPARLRPGGQGTWTRWNADVHAAGPGAITVLARATDTRGDTQPRRAEWNPMGYLWNGYDRVTLVPA